MRRNTLFYLIIFMSVTFIGLIGLQLKFFCEMANMSSQQFDHSVRRSVMQTIRYLEEREALMYLSTMLDEETGSTQSEKVIQERIRLQLSQLHGNRSVIKIVDEIHQEMLEKLERNRDIMNRAVFRWLKDDNKTIEDRINYEELELALSNLLAFNGLDIPFAFTINNSNDSTIYTSELMRHTTNLPARKKYTYDLFPLEPIAQNRGYITLYFPTRPNYLKKSLALYTPSFLLMSFVLIIFIITLIIIFRQRKLNTMKNDFIDNITHEFKTPISSISLAAQMLRDDSIQKTPKAVTNLSKIIREETGRLNMLIERVLQLSLFEQNKSPLQFTDIQINSLLEDISHNFSLKVEKNKGQIFTHFDATDDIALVDEVHFTNVIYNLLDNALKYSSAPLLLHIRTYNTREDKLVIEVEDNGIGIAETDIKLIFDKFYRVPTENVHNVKGFGMGLAYVKKMISEHHGTIQVISELNIGTKFIITIPTLKNDYSYEERQD